MSSITSARFALSPRMSVSGTRIRGDDTALVRVVALARVVVALVVIDGVARIIIVVIVVVVRRAVAAPRAAARAVEGTSIERSTPGGARPGRERSMGATTNPEPAREPPAHHDVIFIAASHAWGTRRTRATRRRSIRPRARARAGCAYR